MFLVFEGADGVGKTTQAELLEQHLRRRRGLKVLAVREPGGTALGERVRRILLDPRTGELDAATEMLLFMAARVHLLHEKVLPALKEGRVVICDRFLWSSVVYQGMAAGLGARLVLSIGRLLVPLQPSRTFLIDLPRTTASRRVGAGRRARGRDRMEGRGPAFQEEVRRAFLALARRHPLKTAIIDGRGSALDVHRRVLRSLPQRGWPR